MLTAPLIIVLCVWLFCLGGAVGSFLNVVIYRLPAGISLVHPGSRCPICLTPILARDNIPVLGWLLLRGRCRSCRAPIAARYPIVELAIGMLFVALAVTGPLAMDAAGSGLSLEMLWGRYAYHLFLACSLIAAALTTWDRQQLAERLTLTTFAIGFSLPLAWPELRLLPGDDAPSITSVDALQDGMVGMAAAALLAYAAARGGRLVKVGYYVFQPPTWMLLFLGVCLGWRAVSLLAIVSLLGSIALRLFRRSPLVRLAGWSVCLTATSLIWLLGEPRIMQGLPELARFEPSWFAAIALALGCLSWLECKIDHESLD